ncbi:hypothetical protein EAI_03178 [Harpegnathos saltator]|uniref:Uncharacterized protein n=1 Tax=Harpegnathos saltator TaxID=610380 RepID=E2BKS1_HARSA|nr:hypothetical protein EAI_03178 [Harpegnathos saltator]
MPPGVGVAKLSAYVFEASAYSRLMCVVKSHILPEVPLFVEHIRSRLEKVYNKSIFGEVSNLLETFPNNYNTEIKASKHGWITLETTMEKEMKEPTMYSLQNVHRLNNKEQEILQEMEDHIGICSLSEIKKRGRGIRCDNYILAYNRKDENGATTSGVIVLFYGRYEININIEYNSDGILTVNMQGKPHTFCQSIS